MRASLRIFALGWLCVSALRCDSPPRPATEKKPVPSAASGVTRPASLPPPLRFARADRPDPPAPLLVRTAPENLIVEVPPAATVKSGESPISLTASDGTGLRLVRMEARAVLQGPLAFTELHLRFENREPRRMEGRFSIVLPPGAAVSRFAMQLASGWQEAEVVERQAARRAYEDFLHRRQDPALLEHEAGNQFSARVFPIEANGVKDILLSYSQELPSADAPYRLPLVGLPEMAEFSITAIAGDQVTDVAKRSFRPASDMIIRPPTSAAGRAAALRAGELVVARLRLDSAATAPPPPPPTSLLLLFDTSASRAPGFAERVRGLGELLQAFPKALPVTIACFDQTVELIYEGALGELPATALTRITQRGPLGASNLQAALAFAAERPGAERVLLLTDGVVTAGAAGKELATAVERLREKGTKRLDVALYGGIRDAAAMSSLTSGHLPQDGVVVDGDKGNEELLRRFSRATLSGVNVAVAGADFVWPQRLDGVQPGDDFIVYAELPAASQAQSVTVKLSGALQQDKLLPLVAVTRPLVERALVQAYIKSLDQRVATLDKKQQEVAALRHEIVSLSTHFRVLSSYTALLVLETEADYARFSIDRKALADILAIGDRGLEVVHRTLPAVAAEKKSDDAFVTPDRPHNLLKYSPDQAPKSAESAEEKRSAAEPEVADPSPSAPPAGSPPPSDLASIFSRDTAMGVDSSPGLGGLVGTGRGGGGTGEGTIGLGNLGTIGRGAGSARPNRDIALPFEASRSATVPGISFAEAEVRGSIDKDVIRRVIMRHRNELSVCYESGRSRNPALQGRVRIQFTIAMDGAVQSALVQSSTLGNEIVEGCIAAAFRRWAFPRPSGGLVIVTYPLMFEPGQSVIPSHLLRRMNREPPDDPKTEATPAYTGKMAQVMALLKSQQVAPAQALAEKWRAEEAGDILALIALGEVLEARRDAARAARAYGSIIDLFPSRADLRRFAGERLERLAGPALALAADTYEKAVEQRPDHPAGHRLLAYVLLKQGQLPEAFAAIEVGANRQYPDGRFARVHDVLREDAQLIAAAWAQKAPAQRKEIAERLLKLHATFPTEPSLRFVLNWETDANDVDFHIHDGRRGHAFFSEPKLPSGGELYADVTTGYGPELFNIPGKAQAFPYKLEAHYYSRGPMGYGMGKLQIIAHDGNGGLKFLERPFIVMNDQAYVDLGTLKGPL